MRFDIGALHAIGGDQLVEALVIFCKKFSQGLAPVGEEAFTPLGTVDDFTGQHRQPGLQGVTATGQELLRQMGRPSSGSGFITIHQHVRDAPLAQQSAGGFLIQVYILPEIPLPCALIHFIDLQSGRIGGSGMIHFPGQRSAETVDAPTAGRQRTDQSAFRRKLIAQVQHVSGSRKRIGGSRLGRITVEVVAQGEFSLFLDMLHLADGMERKILHMGPANPEITRLGGRDVHRRKVLGRFRDAQKGCPVLPVVADL